VAPLTLYDAPRCPYCARVRIALAEKGVAYETVVIDLSDRPAWLYEKNPKGKVPVLEEGSFVLPESEVIDEYLEERFPEPALLPGSAAERALARVRVKRFEEDLGDPYYAFRRGGPFEPLERALAELDRDLRATGWLSGSSYGLADIGYVPWVVRARDMLGVNLTGWDDLTGWLDRLSTRPAVAAELQVVAAL
jgi:glutathione S-transferase